MSITCTNLLNGYATISGATTWSTSSAAFVAGKYYMLLISEDLNPGATTTVTGVAGISWSLLESGQSTAQAGYWRLYGGLATSTVSAALSGTFSANMNGAAVSFNLDELGGVASSGTVVQHAQHSANGNPSVTLSTFASVNNATYAIGTGDTSSAPTQKSGYTKVSGVRAPSAQSGYITEFLASNDTTPSIGCTFNTGHNCTFNTGSDCTFKTDWNCTFDTDSNCTFKTGSGCTFEVGEKCSLTYTWNDCFEVYKLVPNKIVKLLENGKLEDVAPVKPKQTVTLELTEEQLEQVKKTLGI